MNHFGSEGRRARQACHEREPKRPAARQSEVGRWRSKLLAADPTPHGRGRFRDPCSDRAVLSRSKLPKWSLVLLRRPARHLPQLPAAADVHHACWTGGGAFLFESELLAHALHRWLPDLQLVSGHAGGSADFDVARWQGMPCKLVRSRGSRACCGSRGRISLAFHSFSPKDAEVR